MPKTNLRRSQKELEKCLKQTGVLRLRAKHRNQSLVLPWPDLSTNSAAYPSINTVKSFSGLVRTLPHGAKPFPVGHLHKQGLQLITPGAIKDDLPYYGGKKS